MIEIGRLLDTEIVTMIRLLGVELTRRHGKLGRTRKERCARGHEMALTRSYVKNGYSSGCGICKGIRGKRRNTRCTCSHPFQSHTKKECYHKDKLGFYDCECVDYAAIEGTP